MTEEFQGMTASLLTSSCLKDKQEAKPARTETYLDYGYRVWGLKDSGHWKKEIGPAMTSEEIGA